MALPKWSGHRRGSFVDARQDGRRMTVTWHADARVVVLSLWQDQTCRSTFQLPVESAPALIGALSVALDDALAPEPPAQLRPPQPDSRPGVVARMIAGLRRPRPHPMGEVVPFPGSRRRSGGPRD